MELILQTTEGTPVRLTFLEHEIEDFTHFYVTKIEPLIPMPKWITKSTQEEMKKLFKRDDITNQYKIDICTELLELEGQKTGHYISDGYVKQLIKDYFIRRE